MNRQDVVQAALRAADTMASDRIRREDARLYSQHSRLQNQQAGLATWTEAEAQQRLSDAVLLISAGTMLKEDANERWRQCFQRSGELLEWLSHPNLGIGEVPVTLLSAASYVVAGYPARANALLRDANATGHSKILSSFFRGNLSDALEGIREFWQQSISRRTALPDADGTDYIASRLVDEVLRSLGVICSSARWDNEARIESAVQKLNALAAIYTSDHDPFSWLLARLTCSVAQEFTTHAWRTVLADLVTQVPEAGRTAIDRYCRLAFSQDRPRAWPSQEEGIARLLSDGSFALCTPTGSGKTSVAEVALLLAMFSASPVQEASAAAPLAMYLVPSRALAAEVEGKLTTVFKRLSDQRVIVTGLYGGTDWGPTDAWLTSDEPTILICTYEKAEALIRFVGPLMLGRLSLVIFDEAHTVQFNGRLTELRQSENRPLRLEALGLRLSQMIDRKRCRLIALSAVAAGIEESLQYWVSGTTSGVPVRVSYRSTRQLIGRLLAAPNGSFEIRYDVLDGHRLSFTNDPDATPYVREPIPRRPAAPNWTGPEKGLRPALFWAALQLSKLDEHGRRHAVLISITMKIAGYAKDLLELLDTHWTEEAEALLGPVDAANAELLLRAQRVAEDYFGASSYEYRLLQFGVAIHHASMPKPLTRLILQLVQERVLSIVLATSTLSEGINIPVETIIVPSLYRGANISRMSPSEFRNLAGRAGRPGVATEGRTLVLMRPPVRRQYDRAVEGYSELIDEIAQIADTQPQSPLAAALEDLRNAWTNMTGIDDHRQFLEWLETVTIQGMNADQAETFGCIDAVDNVLLSALVESDEMAPATSWEDQLQKLWNASFAAHTATEDTRLSFLRRGEAIPTIYPQKDSRRKIYRTGLPPSTAYELLGRIPRIRNLLETGVPYGRWDPADRFQFVALVVEEIGSIKRFKVPGSVEDWRPVLRWWLIHESSAYPEANRIAQWLTDVHQWFGYRFCWGLGSVIGAAFDDISDGQLTATTLDDWELTGLPWISFWLKELITWGTLDPVAAYLMSNGIFLTRAEAELQAGEYYRSFATAGDNELLDPRVVRDWVLENFPQQANGTAQLRARQIPANIIDQTVSKTVRQYRVLPIFEEAAIGWIDVAGYVLAKSARHALDDLQAPSDTIDFVLDVKSSRVIASPYL